MLRLSVCLLLATFCVGCFEAIPPSESAQTADAPSTPDSPEAPPAETPPPGDSVPATPLTGGGGAPANPAPEPPSESKPKKGIIHQTTDQVVDAKEWLKKEGIEAKDGNIEGVDPFSRSASSYFTLAAQTSTLGLKQSVQHYRALNDKWPSYKEFMQMMRDNRIEFAKLRWYEIYAYNEDTGNILVLVDTVAKEEGP